MNYKLTQNNELIINKYNIKGNLKIVKKNLQRDKLKLINLNGKVSHLILDRDIFIEEIDCKNLKKLTINLSNIISEDKLTKFINAENVRKLTITNDITNPFSDDEYRLFKEFKNINEISYLCNFTDITSLNYNYKFNIPDIYDVYKYNGIMINGIIPYISIINDYEEIRLYLDNKIEYVLTCIKDEYVSDGILEIPSIYKNVIIQSNKNLNFNKILISDDLNLDLTKLNNYKIDEIKSKDCLYMYNLNIKFNSNNLTKISGNEGKFEIPKNLCIDSIETGRYFISLNSSLNNLNIWYKIKEEFNILNLYPNTLNYQNNNKIITIPKCKLIYDYNYINIDVRNIKDEIINLDFTNLTQLKSTSICFDQSTNSKKLNITLPLLTNKNIYRIDFNNYIVNELIIKDTNINCVDNKNNVKIPINTNDKIQKIYINSEYYLIIFNNKSLIVDKNYMIYEKNSAFDINDIISEKYDPTVIMNLQLDEQLKRFVEEEKFKDNLISKIYNKLIKYNIDSNEIKDTIKDILLTQYKEDQDDIINRKLLLLSNKNNSYEIKNS